MAQIGVKGGSCELGGLVVHECVSGVCCSHSALADYDRNLESRICASASVLEEQVWRGESMAISFPHALCRDC